MDISPDTVDRHPQDEITKKREVKLSDWDCTITLIYHSYYLSSWFLLCLKLNRLLWIPIFLPWIQFAYVTGNLKGPRQTKELLYSFYEWANQDSEREWSFLVPKVAGLRLNPDILSPKFVFFLSWCLPGRSRGVVELFQMSEFPKSWIMSAK